MKIIKLLLLVTLTYQVLCADVADKWKVNAGAMFVTNFETEMQLTPKNLPLSLRINTKDQLGMKNETGVLRLDGYYRFNDRHRMEFSYFRVTSNGSIISSKELLWDDQNISAGASVESYFNMAVYKVNYGYSFYHNKKVELTLTAGLHITTIELGLTAKGTINGSPSESYNSGAVATLPLPVIGFNGEYTIINKRLFVNYKTDYFVIKMDDFNGMLLSSALNLEYRFVDHVGVGLGYNSNKIFVEATNNDNKLEISNDLSGVLLYFTYIY